MALTIFDVHAGESRDITQADVDELLVIRASHQRLLSYLADERTRVLTEIQAVREKHAQAKEKEADG